MAAITFKGIQINTVGVLPANGSQVEFNLTKTDLDDVSMADFKGKKIIMNIFPSLDTPTCALSVKNFNTEAAQLGDTVVLCISMDLPFAQARFCGAEGLKNVVPLSAFRNADFGTKLGVAIAAGHLKGLFSRAILVLNKEGKVVYREQVSEITHEPNYADAIVACRSA